jgi:Creatinase/Prolidase N-terminal domain
MKWHGFSIYEQVISLSIQVCIRSGTLEWDMRALPTIIAVFFAYAIVTKTHATLFLNENQIDGDVLAHLGHQVSLRPYDEIFSHIEELRAMPNDEGNSVSLFLSRVLITHLTTVWYVENIAQ